MREIGGGDRGTETRGQSQGARPRDTEVGTETYSYQQVPSQHPLLLRLSPQPLQTEPQPHFAPQEAESSQLRIYWRKCNHIKT